MDVSFIYMLVIRSARLQHTLNPGGVRQQCNPYKYVEYLWWHFLVSDYNVHFVWDGQINLSVGAKVFQHSCVSKYLDNYNYLEPQIQPIYTTAACASEKGKHVTWRHLLFVSWIFKGMANNSGGLLTSIVPVTKGFIYRSTYLQHCLGFTDCWNWDASELNQTPKAHRAGQEVNQHDWKWRHAVPHSDWEKTATLGQQCSP